MNLKSFSLFDSFSKDVNRSLPHDNFVFNKEKTRLELLRHRIKTNAPVNDESNTTTLGLSKDEREMIDNYLTNK